MDWKLIETTPHIPVNTAMLFLWKDADWEEGKLVEIDNDNIKVEVIREEWQQSLFDLELFSHFMIIEFPN